MGIVFAEEAGSWISDPVVPPADFQTVSGLEMCCSGILEMEIFLSRKILENCWDRRGNCLTACQWIKKQNRWGGKGTKVLKASSDAFRYHDGKAWR